VHVPRIIGFRFQGSDFRIQGPGFTVEGAVYGMFSDSEAGSYLRLMDFVYHSTRGSRVMTKKKVWNGHRCSCLTEAGSYLRLIDSCITQLKAQGHSTTCNESKEEEEEGVWNGHRCSCLMWCSGSEASSYLRLIDFVYHSTLGSRVIKKKGMGRTSLQLLDVVVHVPGRDHLQELHVVICQTHVECQHR